MLDIHNHILPGIDDGAENLDVSLEMARIASSDGIKTVVATPHVEDAPVPMETIKAKCVVLGNKLASSGIDIELVPGAEVSILGDLTRIRDYTINASRYVLVELPWSQLPDFVENIIFNIVAQGLVPVIAHPERNTVFLRNPLRLKSFLRNGILLQITSGSLIGIFGKTIQKMAENMLREGVVSVVASDAHSAGTRAPLMREAYDISLKLVGKDMAMDLFYHNPMSIISDMPVKTTGR